MVRAAWYTVGVRPESYLVVDVALCQCPLPGCSGACARAVLVVGGHCTSRCYCCITVPVVTGPSQYRVAVRLEDYRKAEEATSSNQASNSDTV